MAFRLLSTAILYKDLGRYDAVVEFTEVAVRDFLAQGTAEPDFDTFLHSKAEFHSIRLKTVDQSVLRARISHSYILSVYQTTEHFLYEFRDDYNDLFGTNHTLSDTKENLLLRTIKALSAINPAMKHIGEHRFALFNYYRTVRNKYSHERIDEDKVENAFNALKEYKTEIAKDFPGLTAPNPYEAIAFDDFILFTYVVKEIADKMNELISPTNATFVDYINRKNLFSRVSQNPERKLNALRGHLKTMFGIEQPQIEEIIKLLPR